MTVAQLRAILETLPGDLPVVHLYDGFPSDPDVSRVTFAQATKPLHNPLASGLLLNCYPDPQYAGPTIDAVVIGDVLDASMHGLACTALSPEPR